MKKIIKDYINNDNIFDKKTLIGIIALVIVISGIFGWVYEFIFYYFNSGMKTFYMRGGNFLPFINIYAYGALFIWFLTYKYRNKPLKVFIISTITCGVLELLSGWFLYDVLGFVRCWSYNEEILNFGNIGGFICLRSVLFFGLSGLLLIYIILPVCFYIARKMNKKLFLIITITICSIFLIDEIYNLIITNIFSLPHASELYKSIGFKYIYFNR